MNKIQNENIVTPAGRAIYPWLINPDTKFNALGEYKVSLSLNTSEAEPLIKKIDEAMEKAKTLAPEGKKVKVSDPPYFNEVDGDEQETGNVLFKFKSKAQIQTKDGKTIKITPKLFDSKGTLLKDVTEIWGGSTIKISADIAPYFVGAVGAGVSLRLKAVQIIELVTGGNNADSYGFESTEGYEVSKETNQSEFNSSDAQEDF
tara:strand:+ start:715 stop:1323 length:609 start_codon:yes stop_codon:yes gene_type:complete